MAAAGVRQDGLLVGRHRRGDVVAVLLLAAISPAILIALSIAEPYAGKVLGLAQIDDIWFNESFMIGTLLATPATGSLLRRYGFVALMRVSLLGSLVTAVLFMSAGLVSLPGEIFAVLPITFALGCLSAPLAPAAQAFVVATYAAEKRGRGLAMWGFGRFGGFLLMALLAGPLIEASGWSVCMALVPLFILPSLFLLRQPEGLSFDRAEIRDRLGIVTLAFGLLPLLIATNLADKLHTGSGFWLAVVAACVLVAAWAFVRHERHAAEPIVPLTPLRNRGFALATFAAFVIAVMTTGQFSILMLSEVAHVSPDWISFRTVCGGLGQILGITLGGLLAVPLLARPGALLALVLTALGLASFTLYGTSVDLVTISLTRALMGVGLGISVPVFAAFAYGTIKESQTAAASTLFVFAGMLGTEVGLAVLGSVYADIEATTGSALVAYRSIFWIEAAGVAALIALLGALRLPKTAKAS